MLYALDTEFIENGHTIELLSIALVAEDGRELYLENGAVNRCKANAWVREHVLPHLHPLSCPDDGHICPVASPDMLRAQILRFTGERPQFLGYYSAYDWVALCQLFGCMIDLPLGWPMYCRDLRQWLDEHTLEGVVQSDSDEQAHHALYDARWIMQTYVFYSTQQPVPGCCNVCGGQKVFIRGKHPQEPARSICPVCAQERLEHIHAWTAPWESAQAQRS